MTSAARVLAAWRIPALTFGPSAALELLTMLADPGPFAGQARPRRRGIGRRGIGRRGGEPRGGGRRGDGGRGDGRRGGGRVRAARARAGARAERIRAVPGRAGAGWPRRHGNPAGGGCCRYSCRTATGSAARWHPVLSGADAQRARELAAAICGWSAVPPRPPGEPPDSPVLASALEALADSRARVPGSLRNHPRSPARPKRPASDQVAQLWLAALTAADGHVELGDAAGRDGGRRARGGARGLAQRRASPGRAGPDLRFRLIEPEPSASPRMTPSRRPGRLTTPSRRPARVTTPSRARDRLSDRPSRTRSRTLTPPSRSPARTMPTGPRTLEPLAGVSSPCSPPTIPA